MRGAWGRGRLGSASGASGIGFVVLAVEELTIEVRQEPAVLHAINKQKGKRKKRKKNKQTKE